MKSLVIYHADCTDGFGAAFAAWMKLGGGAEYVPMQYGSMDLKPGEVFNQTKNYHKGHRFHPKNLAGKELYILDFSFSRATMEHLFANAKRVVWLDHHKTAFEMWCSPEERTFFEDDFDDDGSGYVLLDNNKSGALLAWEYFHPGTEVPMLIQHIDDRDRWQFKIEGSRELHAALSSYKPWSFEQWVQFQEDLDFPDGRKPRLYTEGSAILRAQDQHVKSMAKQARKCKVTVQRGVHPEYGQTYEHFPGLAVNASLHQSEVGHELANQSGTYGLVWYLGADNKVRCSLRSNGDYDVSAIAKSFGGGGHRNAAGFETDIDTLMGWLK